jgi:hypothetical protein
MDIPCLLPTISLLVFAGPGSVAVHLCRLVPYVWVYWFGLVLGACRLTVSIAVAVTAHLIIRGCGGLFAHFGR